MTNVNEAPTDIALSNSSVAENQPSATPVGNFSTTDPDAGDTHSYSLVSGTGDTDNASFQIVGNQLQTNAVFNFEVKNSYTIRVRTTDQGGTGLTFEEVFIITIVDVPEPPIAADDAYDTIGNTRLEVHNTPAAAGPKVVVIGDVMDNDTDPDTGATLSVTPNSGTTTKGGSFAIAADGTFTYEPEAGDVHGVGTEDTFDYTLSDGSLTDTGTVKIKTAERVWYVNNDATAGGTGRSNDPFDTLAEAQTASSANDYIFVYFGDGTTTGQDAGIALKNGQHLIGEHAGLTVAVAGMFNGVNNPNVSLVPAAPGNRPMLDDTALAAPEGVAATNVIPVEIVGLNLAGFDGTLAECSIPNSPCNAIDWTVNGSFAGSGTLTIRDNVVRFADAEGVDITHGGTGAFATKLAFYDNNLTATGSALETFENGTGVLTITAFHDNVVSGASAGAGLVVNTAVFDADTTTGGIQAVAGGTTAIGSSGNPIGGAGLTLTSVSGNLNFANAAGSPASAAAGDLDIYTDSGAALSVVGTAPGFTINVTDNAGVLVANAGPAAVIVSATIDLELFLLTSGSSATIGVSLTNVTGTFSVPSGSSITNAGTTDFEISGGTANVTYGGTITDDVGQLVSVSGTTAGTKTFSGAISDGNDGDGSGISLSSNTGATIEFTGGVTLSTGANPAFAATGGGTLKVTGTNTATTTTATALNIANTTIHADDVTFRSISSNGGSNSGIVLNNTGALGGLKVVGNAGSCTSAATCTGGAIQNKTVNGISIQNTRETSFTRMFIDNNDGSGIFGDDVTDFSLINSFVSNNADSSGGSEAGLRFNELLGNCAITNSTITGSSEDNVRITPASGVLTNLAVSGSTITANSAAHRPGRHRHHRQRHRQRDSQRHQHHLRGPSRGWRLCSRLGHGAGHRERVDQHLPRQRHRGRVHHQQRRRHHLQRPEQRGDRALADRSVPDPGREQHVERFADHRHDLR